MRRPLLLALFAHPDDEAFSCAGTLAAATSRGIDVAVVSATRGEAGRARDGLLDDFASRRAGELAASCRTLGTRPPRFLDLPDGRLAHQREALGAALLEVLHVERPDAAITMGADGVYGHLDHVVCSEVLTDAASKWQPAPSVLHTVFPAGMFDELRRRLRRARVPLAPRGDLDAAIDYRIDIRPFRQRKLDSIAAHRSQLVDGDPRSFLLPGIVERLLDEECFRHAAGPGMSGALAELFGERR